MNLSWKVFQKSTIALFIYYQFFSPTLPGITNVKFICGKAEDVIIDTTSNLKEASVVGIVDPPRAGCRKLSKVIDCNMLRLLHGNEARMLFSQLFPTTKLT